MQRVSQRLSLPLTSDRLRGRDGSVGQLNAGPPTGGIDGEPHSLHYRTIGLIAS